MYISMEIHKWSAHEFDRNKSRYQEKSDHSTECRDSTIESTLKEKWSIDKWWSPSHKLDDLDLLSMEEYRIPDHGIDDDCDREYEKSEKCIDSIWKSREKWYHERHSLELTLEVEIFAIECVLIIEEHIFLFWDDIVELTILIEWDIIDTKWVWEWILSAILYEGGKIRIALLQEGECLLLWYCLDRDTSEGGLEGICESPHSYIARGIATLEAHGEGDTIIHRRDESLWSEEYAEEDIHEKYKKRDHEYRRYREEWITDNIAEGVEEDAHRFLSFRAKRCLTLMK